LIKNVAPMSVQRWVTTSDVAHVAGVRRELVAFAGDNGVEGAVLTDLALAVAEMVANVALHGDPTDEITVDADIGDDEVTVVVRGAGVGLTPHVDGPAIRMGMVIVAALADDVRVGPTLDGGREVSMTFRRTARTAAADDPLGPAPHR
jgi:anti-sigma regulatory factor (Ser/Thr protein kinase)